VIRGGERLVGVLLDEQDGEAPPLELCHPSKHRSTTAGIRPSDRAKMG